MTEHSCLAIDKLNSHFYKFWDSNHLIFYIKLIWMSWCKLDQFSYFFLRLVWTCHVFFQVMSIWHGQVSFFRFLDQLCCSMPLNFSYIFHCAHLSSSNLFYWLLPSFFGVLFVHRPCKAHFSIQMVYCWTKL